MVDNAKAIDEKKRQQQEDFKKNLQTQKLNYQQELARRIQKVYNKPLMFETVTQKVDKFTVNKNMQEKLNEILYNEEGQVSNTNKDDEIYEEKFDDE